MNKKYLASLLGMICLISVGQAVAEQSYHITGDQLLSYCKDTISMMDGSKDYNVSKSSFCIGFVQGAVTAHRFFSAYYTLKLPDNRNLPDAELEKKIAAYQVYCVPPEINLGQIIRSVVKYLTENPQYQKEQASIAIARALNQTYPCK